LLSEPVTLIGGARFELDKRRILVVDDNETAANVLAMLLKALGNEVRTAFDGLTAIDLAEQFRPDIVLLDIGMPKLNGYETARRIRAQPWGRDMVLAALTGWGQEEDKRRTREAGFDHHFVKPVEPDVLQKLLAEHEPSVR
jgi:CheY-like chemotaxis protein